MRTIRLGRSKSRVSCSLVGPNIAVTLTPEARGEVHPPESLVTRPRQFTSTPASVGSPCGRSGSRRGRHRAFHLGTGSHIVGAAMRTMQPRRAARGPRQAPQTTARASRSSAVRSTGRDRHQPPAAVPSYRGKPPPPAARTPAAWPARLHRTVLESELRDEGVGSRPALMKAAWPLDRARRMTPAPIRAVAPPLGDARPRASRAD